MGITMEELAVLAKVSQSTVSLVLNGKGDGRIAKPKQERIRELARQHNYRPNMAARGLRAQRQYTIGIIMPTPANSFYANMVSGLQFELAKRGYMGLFSFCRCDEELPKAYDSALQHNVDGIISWVYHECLHSETVPTVIYYYHEGNDFSCIELNGEAYAHDAIDYLVSLGHTRIGFGLVQQDVRYECLMQYRRELGLPENPAWSLSIPGTLQGGVEFMTHLLSLKDRPTAIMLNDSMAYSAIAIAARAGLKIPRDLSIIGYNDLEESSYFEPPLTTFNCHNREIVDSLIELVLERIENPSAPVVRRYITKSQLIIRESCAKPNT